MFAVIVIPLSLLGLKEQAIVQMSLGVLRYLTVAIIVIYCIVKLVQVGDICLPLGNETDGSDETGCSTSKSPFRIGH